MVKLRFSWDPRKARSNERKHGISFEEATTVFLDEHALLLDDPDHSSDEERILLLGLSSFMRLLVVCHCYGRGTLFVSSTLARRPSESGGNIRKDWKDEERIRFLESQK